MPRGLAPQRRRGARTCAACRPAQPRPIARSASTPLAAAYAELGRFPDALAAAQKALELAEKQENRKLAEDIQARIALYQSGKPYRKIRD